MTAKIPDFEPRQDEPEPDAARPNPAPADDTALQESLAGLSHLVVNDDLDLTAVLTHVAEFAVHAIPGAEGAGLTLLQDNQPAMLVASAEFVRRVDAIQYGLGEGPCITAAESGRTVRSGALGSDPSWPRFGPRVGRLGVHSVVSLPLLSPEGVLGAMNVYAHAKNTFDERAVEVGEQYAIPAAISVQNAQALTHARALTVQLKAALATRPVIDQAIGILMSRSGCSQDEAFDKLRVRSQAQNRKVAVIAQQLVDEAVRRVSRRRAT